MLPVAHGGSAGDHLGPEHEDAERITDDLAQELMGQYLHGDSWTAFN